MKHHPSHELLTAFVGAELPASLSVVISAHIELCPQCQCSIEALNRHHAEQVFVDKTSAMDNENRSDKSYLDNSFEAFDTEFGNMFDDMVDSITASAELEQELKLDPVTICFKGQQYTLPHALRSLTLQKPQSLGKITRSRVDLADGQLKTSLLHIEPGGSVPMHTHKGFELTLLLSGEFSDSMGEYQAGDFIWLNGEHEHSPHTETGCLCLSVSSDALQFTQGLSKLLNPIGTFIY